MDVIEVAQHADTLLGKEITVEGRILRHSNLYYLAPAVETPDGELIYLAMDKATHMETLRYIRTIAQRKPPFKLYVTGKLSRSNYGPPLSLVQISQVMVYVPASQDARMEYVECYREEITFDDVAFTKLPTLTIPQLLAQKDTFYDLQVRLSGCLTTDQYTVYLADPAQMARDENDSLLFIDDPEIRASLETRIHHEQNHAVHLGAGNYLSHLPVRQRFGELETETPSQIIGTLRPPKFEPFAAQLVDIHKIAIKEHWVISVWERS